MDQDEIGMRWNIGSVHRVERRPERAQSGAVERRAFGNVIDICQRRQRGRLRDRVDVERLANAIEQIGHVRVHHAKAHPQPGQPVRLGERARHDQIGVLGDPSRARRPLSRIEVLVVGLVEHHHDFARNAVEKRLDCGRRGLTRSDPDVRKRQETAIPGVGPGAIHS